MNQTPLAARPAPTLKMIDTLGRRDGVTWLSAAEAATPAQAMARLRPWPGMVLPVVAADAVPAGLTGWARACTGKARYVMLYGPYAARFAEALAHVGGGVTIVRCADVADAVQAAGRLAQAGDAVALTPVGASADAGEDARFRTCATAWVLGARSDAWVAA